MTAPRVVQAQKKDLITKAAVDQEVVQAVPVVPVAAQAVALIKKVDQDQVLVVRKKVVVDQMMTQTKTQTMRVKRILTATSHPKRKKGKARRKICNPERPTTKPLIS